MDIKNKIAVVTGVSKGIGLALCQSLIKKGCKVYGLGRTAPDALTDLHFIACDVRSHESVKTAIDSIEREHGRIDILVNNAGLGYFGILEDTTI